MNKLYRRISGAEWVSAINLNIALMGDKFLFAGAQLQNK
jgi:hypothetical protein